MKNIVVASGTGAIKISCSYTIDVAGKNMQPDFEGVFGCKIHQVLNCVEGDMHIGQRDIIRVRISKADYKAGFCLRHLGEVLYAKIKSEFSTVVNKRQLRIAVDAEQNRTLRAHAEPLGGTMYTQLGKNAWH